MNYLTHDGSFAGILSCVYYAYEQQLEEVHISTENIVLPTLFTLPEYIATDLVEAKKVAKRLIQLVGYSRFMDLWRISLSNDPLVGNRIFELIRFIQLHQGIMLYDYSHPAIKTWIKELKYLKAIFAEFKHDLYFREDNTGLSVAIVKPEYDLIPLLYPNKIVASPTADFCVFDEKREVGILHKNGKTRLIDANYMNNISTSPSNEFHNQILWMFHLENYKPNRLLRNRTVYKAS